ncbi:aspartate aminotransferase family protein [Coprothermobacter proteolyticus]|uniref:aspartate aminotransferase family protein n=1 Tax=Coprothermobacter proteolyticus TaxID=35786 RepID=UPI000D31FED0|nr:aspartate aminotransferase family protein [Coprothermobacter proteolyticus]
MNPDEILQKYHDHINPGLADLLQLGGLAAVDDKAEGAYVWDAGGNKYLDAVGGYGVFALGHRPPKVIEKVKETLDKMPLASKIFINSCEAELGEKLSEATGYQYFMFLNSGSEAVETALKLARLTTGKTTFIGMTNAYHGVTFGALSVSGRDVYKEPFKPLLPGVKIVPFGDAEALANALDDTVAAVIVEPIQGEGGVNVPPPGYLKKVRQLCDEAGCFLILDEIQTGMGRTGKLLAEEWEDVKADIVCLGKALGGGVVPIGAVGATETAWQGFIDNPLIHESTFGGNPLATSAGIAAVDEIVGKQIWNNAHSTGDKLLSALRSEAEKYPHLIKEVRGRGLLIGVEMMEEGYGLPMMGFMLEEKTLVAYTLNNPRVIRIEPPLIIGDEEIQWLVNAFQKALAKLDKLAKDLEV